MGVRHFESTCPVDLFILRPLNPVTILEGLLRLLRRIEFGGRGGS
jgi:hypothetical protein